MIISTDIVTSNPSLFAYFLFFFFSSFILFLFSSSPACYAPYFSSTGTQPDKYCFTFSAILFECTLRVGLHIACWPLAIGGSFMIKNFTSLALQPLVFRQLSTESGFIIANGSQRHAFSQDRAFLCFVVHAHSIGDRRTETSSCGRKEKNKK